MFFFRQAIDITDIISYLCYTFNTFDMNINTLHQLFLTCNGITTDSRNCPENSMFIALTGDSFNGNAFAAQALENGCAYAVINDSQYKIAGDTRYILVKDTLRTLQLLANYHRRQFKISVIGITGTNGKTTTKELIAAVLSQKYNILYTEGNLNNHIGVPLTLLRLKPEHEIAVIEMGANHPKEIAMLSNIVEPTFGLITNVGKAHLEGFGSLDGVIKTKGELYDFLRNDIHRNVFIHYDNPHLIRISKGLNLIAYGVEDDLYINGTITGNSPYLSLTWKNGPSGEIHKANTRLIGEYNFPNVLAAITIGFFFNVPPEQINRAIEAYSPQNNRSQLKETPDNVLIIDAYNANPTSMMAALENFRNMNMKNKMLILGDMRELGADSAREHQTIVDYLMAHSISNVILVGELFMACQHPFTAFARVEELITAIQENKPRGMTILIKGSNGIRLNKVVEYL